MILIGILALAGIIGIIYLNPTWYEQIIVKNQPESPSLVVDYVRAPVSGFLLVRAVSRYPSVIPLGVSAYLSAGVHTSIKIPFQVNTWRGLQGKGRTLEVYFVPDAGNDSVFTSESLTANDRAIRRMRRRFMLTEEILQTVGCEVLQPVQDGAAISPDWEGSSNLQAESDAVILNLDNSGLAVFRFLPMVSGDLVFEADYAMLPNRNMETLVRFQVSFTNTSGYGYGVGVEDDGEFRTVRNFLQEADTAPENNIQLERNQPLRFRVERRAGILAVSLRRGNDYEKIWQTAQEIVEPLSVRIYATREPIATLDSVQITLRNIRFGCP